jgi:hypothetical protein
MRVFRLEHPTESASSGYGQTLPIGKGIFALLYSLEIESDEHYEAFRQANIPPSVTTDIGEPDTYQVCGFESMEQLFLWFSTEHMIILSEFVDFVIREYEVSRDDVLFGTCQVLFDCTKARPVSAYPV